MDMVWKDFCIASIAFAYTHFIYRIHLLHGMIYIVIFIDLYFVIIYWDLFLTMSGIRLVPPFRFEFELEGRKERSHILYLLFEHINNSKEYY